MLMASLAISLPAGDSPVALFPERYTVPRTAAPAAGSVTFFNEGAYVARFTLSYHAAGRRHQLETGVMPLKASAQTFALPADARNIAVHGE